MSVGLFGCVDVILRMRVEGGITVQFGAPRGVGYLPFIKSKFFGFYISLAVRGGFVVACFSVDG